MTTETTTNSTALTPVTLSLPGSLSALVSHEHFEIDPGLYPQTLEALAGDKEPNFRLMEKINLARLQHLDSEFSDGNPRH